MTQFDDLYEVSREEYEGFLRGLKRGKFTQQRDDDYTMRIVSNASGKDICGYKIVDDITHFYIFNMPSAEESQEVVPTRKIVLTSPEQVQAVLNGLKELKANGGIIPEHSSLSEE